MWVNYADLKGRLEALLELQTRSLDWERGQLWVPGRGWGCRGKGRSLSDSSGETMFTMVKVLKARLLHHASPEAPFYICNWASSAISLGHGFPTCEMGMIILLLAEGCCEE